MAMSVVVVGVGMAGRSRIKDLLQNNCDLELKGFVSRRDISVPGVEKLSFKEALNAADVQAIIISTEPATHEDLIRQALDNGKHVLVEYPLALSAQSVHSLYRLAAEKGLVLHEENISLLTERYKHLKEMAVTRELKCGTSSLTGNYNGWLESLPLEHKPFLSNLSSIQDFYDLFGDLTATGASLDISDIGVKYCGEFITKFGGKVLKISGELFKQKVERLKVIRVEFEDGSIFDSSKENVSVSPDPQKPGLFMQDLEIFASKLRGERTSEADIKRSIRSIELAEEANAFLK